ncbi:MAG TPA: hypothetical protein DCZ84_02170 [Candidatus Vogelbacteria bacterium]|uniref:30S ribosomal protein S21 n=1 Tax=Candidatus Vogelbacteria bacterium RIFOXYD1_FULL_51_18 TaxID=1802440 RepID=A0A1G2QIB6_9BACT|nr:MAG: hypothetical protein UY66_C0005G0018 [Parcubacteria group bacterium GW2011_GWC1_51_35]KKW25337.1 MAG: hypothetical protein UY68_C0003G0037 [Parcubacteria group bacterium GW2011_GWF2_52_12]KKW27314.1 MAG: hypothetical protein UY69_C0015G0016 [Parcubacteria group bacterium GW2011_GWF1_52_5]KKW35039.1 MAG: hypothetical protein UY80_C0001G0024 [Parcubacteria group bacterium GW2011_GWB1_53_43]KKW38791.1 MAG: hypothetical protein UY88_C0001G0017 [Parcubacteria group bacterium GW2011_GWA1_54_8
MIGVEVKRASGETSVSVMRRFSKRMQSAGMVRRAKSLRYHSRNQSGLALKKRALKRITRIAEIERLKKLGKWNEPVGRKPH